jgi:hypothetical protein
MTTRDIVRDTLAFGVLLYVSMNMFMFMGDKPDVPAFIMLVITLVVGYALLGFDIYSSLKRNAKSPLELQIERLESEVKRLDRAKHLSSEAVADLEQMTVAAYKALELATYKSGKDMRKPENANHPVKRLWDRWSTCSDRVGKITDQFLASTK